MLNDSFADRSSTGARPFKKRCASQAYSKCGRVPCFVQSELMFVCIWSRETTPTWHIFKALTTNCPNGPCVTFVVAFYWHICFTDILNLFFSSLMFTDIRLVAWHHRRYKHTHAHSSTIKSTHTVCQLHKHIPHTLPTVHSRFAVECACCGWAYVVVEHH